MPPLHVLLPELERAASRRVEAPLLAEIDDKDLRDLLLKIVDTYQQRLSDPYNYLRQLAIEAQEQHADLVKAREDLVHVRAQFLERLLEIITPAVPALLGPVVESRIRVRGQNEQTEKHALLRGFELVDGKRRAGAGAKKFRISGRSWWIVALTPEDKGDEVTPRYACLEYEGEADEDAGVERWTAQVQLCTPEEVAERIGESVRTKKAGWDGNAVESKEPLEILVDSVLGRLRSAASEKTAQITKSTWTSIQRVEQALDVLRGDL